MTDRPTTSGTWKRAVRKVMRAVPAGGRHRNQRPVPGGAELHGRPQGGRERSALHLGHGPPDGPRPRAGEEGDDGGHEDHGHDEQPDALPEGLGPAPHGSCLLPP